MKQVSVYTANKKGAMYRLTRALADAKVDIRALVTNDSAEFGTIRMIVDHPEVAIDARKGWRSYPTVEPLHKEPRAEQRLRAGLFL